MKNAKEKLEGIEFFDLMQAYRIADPSNQDRVCKKFEDVKDWINEKFIKQNTEMYEALKWLLDNHNDDNIMISSTEMNDKYTEDVLLDKLLKMYSLLKELEK